MKNWYRTRNKTKIVAALVVKTLTLKMKTITVCILNLLYFYSLFIDDKPNKPDP
jgi:hypothetical protein